MLGRRRAREIVMQLLYRDELNRERSLVRDLNFVANRLGNRPELVEFAQNLLRGVRQHVDEVDDLIRSAAENWTLARMTPTDRSILRLAVYEMKYEDTPAQVVINEAIEIAKRYGDNRSGGFVNGILDRLHRGGKGEVDSREKTQSTMAPAARQPIKSVSLANRLAKKGNSN